MVRLNADLIWKILHFFNAIMERELDLRGNKIVIIENIGTTKVTFATCPSFSLWYVIRCSSLTSLPAVESSRKLGQCERLLCAR
ncbi:hypothetical protein ZWY2020_011289 [Hordeum vulgare]|nr:hypothetical protein ZWY2020_011289 [Hordeum vulgare]